MLSYTHPLKQQCTRFLSRHQPLSTRQWLDKIAKSKYCDYAPDFYGSGTLVQMLEDRMADLLGKPKALFCHKGMVVQLSAIKHWSQLKQNNNIAFQPDCHMDCDEQAAYSELLNLNAVLIGSRSRPLLQADCQFEQSISVVSIELPHRRAGFLLPEWKTLIELKQYCDDNSTALHFDGARLFEAAQYWRKTAAEVAALCDSVYVSMYKLFGAMAGGIIAADEETIHAIRPWKSRMGGDVHTSFPTVIGAMMGLDEYLPRIPEFADGAGHVASLVKKVLGEGALPYSPCTNSFHVYMPSASEQTSKIALDIASRDKIWLFDSVTLLPGNKSKVEIQIGDAIERLSDIDIEACLNRFVE